MFDVFFRTTKIKVGDYIEKVNGNVVSDIDNLVNLVNKYQTDR